MRWRRCPGTSTTSWSTTRPVPLTPPAVTDRVVAALPCGAQAVVPAVEVVDTLREVSRWRRAARSTAPRSVRCRRRRGSAPRCCAGPTRRPSRRPGDRRREHGGAAGSRRVTWSRATRGRSRSPALSTCSWPRRCCPLRRVVDHQRGRDGARPSPRPVSPRPSVVVAVTVTLAPAASDSTRSASARRGPSFGSVSDQLHGDVADRSARRASRAAVSVSSATPLAPAHAGSDVPNWLPRSPRPAAESRASQAAWATTSPSEWPSRPTRLVRPRAGRRPTARVPRRAGGRRRRCRPGRGHRAGRRSSGASRSRGASSRRMTSL